MPATRLAVRWASPDRRSVPAALGGEAASPALSHEITADDRWKGLFVGAAGIWAAFYVSLLVQIAWYAITQPWIAAPKPF